MVSYRGVGTTGWGGSPRLLLHRYRGSLQVAHAGSPFRGADVKSERIAVYRAENGERMFSVTIPAPIATMQTSTLSSDGSQLAVLQEGQIALYQVPIAAGR
jgi:hypothetical protein